MPVSEEVFYGGAIFQSISSDFTVYISKRVWNISSTVGLSVLLPDARTLKVGGPCFYIINIGSNLFTIEDNTGSSLNVAGANVAYIIALHENTTQAGTWYRRGANLIT